MKLNEDSKEIINHEAEIILQIVDQLFIYLKRSECGSFSSEIMMQIAIAIYNERRDDIRLIEDWDDK